jgi:hypothetical protein
MLVYISHAGPDAPFVIQGETATDRIELPSLCIGNLTAQYAALRQAAPQASTAFMLATLQRLRLRNSLASLHA